jgi:hypothetical protein
MTKYDKIYVPDEMLGPYEACDIRSGSPEKGRLYKKGNVIVLTIEELKECFGWIELHYGNRIAPEEIFKQYLTSKGIQL